MKLVLPHSYPSYFLLLVILVYTPILSYSQDEISGDRLEQAILGVETDSSEIREVEIFDLDTHNDSCISISEPQEKQSCYQNLARKIKDWIIYASNFKNVDKEVEYFYEIIPKTGEDEYNNQSHRDRIEILRRRGAERKPRSSCTNVDLRDSLGPIRDQDSVGWCYAFAAADLLTHHTGERISASALAMGYNEVYNAKFNETGELINESNIRGGKVKQIFDLIKSDQMKVCSECEIRSEGALAPPCASIYEDVGYFNTLANELDRIENIPDTIEGRPDFWDTLNWREKILYATVWRNRFVEDSERYRTEARNVTGECSVCDVATVGRLFPGLAGDDIQDVTNILSNSSQVNVLDNLIKAACERNKINFQRDNATFEYKRTFYANGLAERLNFLDEHLSNATPVSVSYNAEILNDSNKPLKFGRDLNHASTIAGRRFNEKTGECEYLIRNSWGRSCSRYDRSYTCEEGNIWVPKKILAGSILDINAITQQNGNNNE